MRCSVQVQRSKSQADYDVPSSLRPKPWRAASSGRNWMHLKSKAGEDNCPYTRRQSIFAFPLLYSFSSADQMMPIRLHVDRSFLLSPQSKCPSLVNPSYTDPEIIFYHEYPPIQPNCYLVLIHSVSGQRGGSSLREFVYICMCFMCECVYATCICHSCICLFQVLFWQIRYLINFC